MRRSCVRSLGAWLILRCASLPAAEAPDALAALTYSGDQQSLEMLDRDLAAAGMDAARLAGIEQRLIELLRRPEATYAARQAAAQRLGMILTTGPGEIAPARLKPLDAMLADERDSDLARLALEPAPGAVIDGLFLAALENATGRARLGLLDSIGRRRIVASVPAVAALLRDADPPVADAAARTLGALSHPDALAVLQAVPEPSPLAIAGAKLDAAARLTPGVPQRELLADLQKNARDPAHRVLAFRLSLDTEPGTAAARIVAALSGDNGAIRQVALEAIYASRAPNLGRALLRSLATWDAPTQTAVIAALGRRGDPAATGAVAAATSHQDDQVRGAALAALGLLPGTGETTLLLATLAAGRDAVDAKAARESLARIHGPEVSATILAGAEHAEAGLREVYLEQLALRDQREGVPLLLRTRSDGIASVRSAAVAALGELARPSEQKALLDWAIEATDAGEQSRALRALVNATLRNPAIEERGRVIYAVIESAQPELALRLLPALNRIGGAASANCAARLALRKEPRVAEAATAALTHWDEPAALPALSAVAQKAALPASRTAALEGILAYFDRRREPWNAKMSALVSRLLSSTNEDDARQKLLLLLHRAKDAEALALAEQMKLDVTLASKAADAADVIRANLTGLPTLHGSGESGLAHLLDDQPGTRWSVPASSDAWLELDFHVSRPIARVILDQAGRPDEFPERYEVFVTDDPQQPGAALVAGAGQRHQTRINNPPGTRGRYLILKNVTERKDVPWSIGEVYID